MSIVNKSFGRRLAELRKKHNLQQPEFGAKLGIHSQTVSRYERGLITPGLDILVKISEMFDVSLDWLASNDTKSEISNKYVKIPYLGNPDQYWFIDELFLYNLTHKTNLNALIIKNNHMFPIIQKGDLLLINIDEEEPAIDKIVVIKSGADYIVKKIVSLSKSSVQLVSNDSDKPISVNKDDIIGTVHVFCRGNI